MQQLKAAAHVQFNPKNVKNHILYPRVFDGTHAPMKAFDQRLLVNPSVSFESSIYLQMPP